VPCQGARELDGWDGTAPSFIPGGEHERMYVEDVIAITATGGRPLFSWGFDPSTGR
jgi:hypothetical protein